MLKILIRRVNLHIGKTDLWNKY